MCFNQERLVGRIRVGGNYKRVRELCKRKWNRKKRRGNKKFKKGEKPGSRGGYVKKGGGRTPLQTKVSF